MIVPLLVLIPFVGLLVVGVLWSHYGTEPLRRALIVMALICAVIDLVIVLREKVFLK